jgi:hypothetical protein
MSDRSALAHAIQVRGNRVTRGEVAVVELSGDEAYAVAAFLRDDLGELAKLRAAINVAVRYDELDASVDEFHRVLEPFRG